MNWYYKLKLKRIRTEIDKLKVSTGTKLSINYTDNARLRSLIVLADRLEKKLAHSGTVVTADE